MDDTLPVAVLIGLAAGICFIIVVYLISQTFRIPTETIMIDFEDDPINAQLVVCDYPVTAFGTDGQPLPEPTECDPAHHEWIKSKGIDIATSAKRIVRTTQVSGTYQSGLVLESPAPLDDAPEVTFTILNSKSDFFEIEVLNDPTYHIDYNNIPATVVLDAFDSDAVLLNTTTYIFTTITDSAYTPAKLRIQSASLSISMVTLDILSLPTPYPSSGLWIESITFARALLEPSEDLTPPAITVPLPDDWIRTIGLVETGYAKVDYKDRLWLRAYDATDGEVPLDCDPPSGALFPVGRSLVTCAAEDSSGNIAKRSFFVGVVQCRAIPGGMQC